MAAVGIIDTIGFGRAKIAVKPDDPDFVMWGGVLLHVSTNGGNTFQTSAGGYDNRMIYFDPHRAGKVFITSDFGISSLEVDPITATSFTYASETQYDNTLMVQEIYAGDYAATGNLTITGMQDLGSRILYTSASSYFLQGGDGAYAFCCKQNNNLGYFSFQNGLIERTMSLNNFPINQFITNQLDTNNNYQIDEGATFIHPFIMNDADDQQLYYPTLKRLWRTSDGGTNWAPVSNYYGNPANKFSIVASKKINPIVYWSNSDSVFVLPDAATSPPYSEFGFASPAALERIVIDPDNDSCLYFIKQSLPAQILHSSNLFIGNVVWTDIATNFPANVTPLCLAAYPNNNQVILVGAIEGGVYITINGGLTWSKEASFSNVQVKDIKIRPSDKKIFVFTYGRGVWTALMATNVSIHEIALDEIKLYPTMVTDVLHIQTKHAIQSAEVIITTSNGSITYKQFMNIENHAQIDMRNNASGVYFVTIREKGKVLVMQKVLKI